MALYDDASFIFLASGAAGLETKDASKVYNVKPDGSLGSELIINGTFDSDSDWTKGTGFSISGGVASCNGSQSSTTNLHNAAGNGLVNGNTYRVEYTITSYTAGTVRVKAGNTGFGADRSAAGTYVENLVADVSTFPTVQFNADSDFVGSIDNVSCKEMDVADFDISRDANLDATRVGPTGLIEKGRENLVHYSNNFIKWDDDIVDGVANGINGYTITSGKAGYDGSNDATLVEKTGSNNNYIFTDINTVSHNGVFTYSIYARDGGDANSSIHIYIGDSSNKGNLRVNLNTGVVLSGTRIDAVVTPITGSSGDTDRWYRVSFTNDANLSDKPRIQVRDNTGGSNTNGKAFIQDAQFEVGLVATDVITTGVSTATAGIKEDEPRFDYPLAGGAPSLLIEPERKNELPKSEYFPDSQGTRVTVTVNTTETLSPEGVHNAVKMMDEATGDANHTHVIESLETASSLDNSTVYTVSAFVKDNGRDAALNLADSTGLSNRAAFNLSGSGSVITTGAFDSASIEDYGNGWFRIIATGTTDSSAGATKVFLRNLDRSSANDADYLGDATKGIYFYGVQLEKGANATSYIPCHGAAATRSPDTLPEIDLDANGITLGTSVTVFLEASKFSADRQTSFLQLRTGTDSNNRFLFFSNTSAVGATHDINVQHRQSGTAVPKGKSGLTRGDFFKCIGRVDGTTLTMFINGEMLTPATIVATDVFDKISLIRNGDVTDQSGHKIKTVAVWASALTDAQCIALTEL